MLFTNPATGGGQKKLFDTSRRGVPFHPNAANASRNSCAAATARRASRNGESDLHVAIGGKEIVGTSKVFAENGAGRTFVIIGRIHTERAPGHQSLESFVIGVAQIAIKIPGASQWASVSEPRRLGVGTGEKARACRSIFFVGCNHRRVAHLVAQLNPPSR